MWRSTTIASWCASPERMASRETPPGHRRNTACVRRRSALWRERVPCYRPRWDTTSSPSPKPMPNQRLPSSPRPRPQELTVKQVLQNRSSETIVRDVPAPPVGLHDVLVHNAFSAISSGTERARIESKSLLQRGREQPELVRQIATRALSEGVRETAQAVRRKLVE